MHPHLKESRAGHSAKVRKISGAHGTEMLPSGNEPPMQNVANGPPEGPLPQGTRTLPVTTAVTAKPRNNLGKIGSVAKFARGGRAKGKGTNVNIIVAPQGGGAGAGPAVPVPPALPLPRPPAAPPGPPMGAAPGAGGPPPMMPPGMGPRRDGGRTFASGGRAYLDAALDRAEIKRVVKPSALQRKDGGRTYHAGADSGPGRLEKVKNYGRKAHMKPKAV